MIGFDFETSGKEHEYALQPWRARSDAAWPTSLVWAIRTDPPTCHTALFPTVDACERMLDYAIENDCTLVGWNTKFDIAWLIALGLSEKVFKVRWLDGMLLWRHYFIEPEYENRHNRFSYSLKEAVRKFLPQHAGYEEDVEFHSTDPEDLKKLERYNVRDVIFTLRITKMLWHQLEPDQLRCALIEARSLPHAAQAWETGMIVDTLAASELRQWCTDTAAEKLAELAPHGITEKVVRSPMQLARLMYGRYVADLGEDLEPVEPETTPNWGLTPYKQNVSDKTKRKTNSTDKESLYELAFDDRRAWAVKEYREALGNRQKFAEVPLLSVEYNGGMTTHPEPKVFGTYSGRFTYASKQGRGKAERKTGFALHQEKRDAIYRDIIIAPANHTIVEFDAASQEFRWMAVASGDETMMALCEQGEDAHSFMGARVAGEDYKKLMDDVREGLSAAKSSRQLGKVANLSLQYRTSANKLRSVARVQYGIPMDKPTARDIHKKYQLAYPGVPMYWERQIAETRRTGYVETFAGRRVQVTGNWDGDWGWSMGSTAINYRIQGTGADQKCLALFCLESLISRLSVRFAWDLHDGLYFYVPDEHVDEFVEKGRNRLDTMPYEKAWGFTPPIPMPWDCKIGKTWGGLKEID